MIEKLFFGSVVKNVIIFTKIKLVNKNFQDKDFLSVLIKKNGCIDDFHVLNLAKNQELDQMTRIKIAEEKFGLTLLRSLTNSDLNDKLNSISDKEVNEYINKVDSRISSNNKKSTSIRDDLTDFSVALGMTVEESASFSNILLAEFNLTDLSQLKSLEKTALKNLLNRVRINIKTLDLQ